VVVERIARVGCVIEIRARARGSTAACPDCGDCSRRVHSRYERSLADTAIGGQPVRILLSVRRFACVQAMCARKTFVEQVEDLTVRYGRHSQLLRATLESIGLALAGRAGARLTRRLAAPVSRMTLLRLVRALPDPVPGDVSAVGIDDFAFRRGHVYGTIVIDIESHRPLDVLPDRTSDTVAAWIKKHPGIQIVCRDRAGAYAEAARVGAPDAVQVADRWHLWHNLAQAVEKTVVAQRGELRPDPVEHVESRTPDEPALDAQMAEQAATRPDAQQADRPLATRIRERHAAVQALRERGRTITAISRELGLDRRTVRRFAHADHVEDLLDKAGARQSLLDAFKPYLHERFSAGHTDAAALSAEITALGYRGSDKTVRRYLQPFRADPIGPAPGPPAPSVRQVTGWLTRHPDRLSEEERLELKKILDRSNVLTTTQRHVKEFAEMLTQRRGDRLRNWMGDVKTTGAPALRSFANGLGNDLDAVTAGLTLDYSSGAVEGTVNRIKMIKRQMYGRAKFDLLRKRILNPA
jgi:transposase